MARIKVALVCLVFLAVSAATPVQAQNTAEVRRYYQQNTQYVLGSAANLIGPHLTDEERRIVRDVRVRVPATMTMIAQASRGIIVISGGMSWALEQLAVSNIADYEIGYSGCDEAYVLHMGEGLAENSIRQSQGRSLREIYTPEWFGRRVGGACSGFRTQQIVEEGQGEYMARMIEASLMFLYLHEVAHHVLGHVNSAPSDLDYSRQMEAEADAWAIEAGFRADYNVLVAAPFMNLAGVLGGASLEAEKKSTHPLGVRRVRDMLHQARNILERQDKEDVVAWIDEQLENVEARMPE